MENKICTVCKIEKNISTTFLKNIQNVKPAISKEV